MDNIIQGIAIYALPVIFAITLHEAAHGYVAKYFGDLTAEMAGRITLNPLRHIDPVGTILLPLMMFVTSKLLMGSGLLFGWAKPVPVNFGRLRQPKKDMLWVAAAGPGANLLMAFFWAAIIKLGMNMPDSIYLKPMVLMGIAGIEINVVLMVLNRCRHSMAGVLLSACYPAGWPGSLPKSSPMALSFCWYCSSVGY